MTLDEAYKTLGLNKGASKTEVSKAFKKLAAEHHPDSSKSPDEAKFKKINEAKQIIDSPPKEPQFNDFMGSPGWNVVNINMGSPRSHTRHPDPVLDVDLTFEESALGVKKKITYDRYIKCDDCDGNGFSLGSNICDVCGGQGGIAMQRGNIRMIRECEKCHGSGRETVNCTKCGGEGLKKQSITQEVKLPPGLHDGEIIRGAGNGNYRGVAPGFGGMRDLYGNVLIRIHVLEDPDMVLDESGENVESTIKLSLVEALKGINKKVRTLKGELTLKIRPGAKNGNKIIAKGYGSGFIGNHIFTLDVEYPEDTSRLIEFLDKEK